MFKAHAWADEEEWRVFFLNPMGTHKKNRRNYLAYPRGKDIEISNLILGPNCDSDAKKYLARAAKGSIYETLPLFQ